MIGWLKRHLLALGITLGATLLLAGGALYYFTGILASFTVTIPVSARPNLTPAYLGLFYEEISTVSVDGYHLKAWSIPAPAKAPPLPSVIVIHGLGMNKEFMLGYVALAHAAGHPVLAIDLRGHGDSDPSLTTLGEREPLDIEAWINLLEQEGQAQKKPLLKPILWGTSLGAVTALRTAAADPRVGGVIADAPFDTLRHTMAVHAKLFFNLPEYPLVPLTAWQVSRKLRFNIDDVNSFQAVRAIHVPILILAAEKDRRMALPSVRSIFDAANEPKQFYLIPGEDHERRPFSPAFRDRITHFLDTCDAWNGIGQETAVMPTP